MVSAGANYLVGGTSSIFQPGITISEGVRRLRTAAEGAPEKPWQGQVLAE